MTYLTYPQVEELLKCYPKLKTLLKNLQVELEGLYHDKAGEGLDPDDILYSLMIGNRVMSDMPFMPPSPGEKMTNIVYAKDKIINKEMKYLIQTINTIGEVVEKVANTLSCLTELEREIIDMRYFQELPWKAIVGHGSIYLEDTQVRLTRRVAVEKICPLLRVTKAQLDFCLNKVKGDSERRAIVKNS